MRCVGGTTRICFATTLTEHHRRMFKYSSAFNMIFWDRNSLWIGPFITKNAPSVVFTCEFDIRAFFGLSPPSPTHCILWRVVSGSYSKSHCLSQVITLSRMFSDSIASSQSQQTLARRFFYSLVRFFGTSLALSFRIRNSSFTIKRTISRLIDSSSATALMDKW